MIIDSLKNCELYYPVNKNFKKSFEFIKDFKQNPKAVGRYEIDGDAVYAMVMDCELKEQGRLETHKKYIDIQFIISDSEYMGYANADNLQIDQDRLVERDICFFKPSEAASKVQFFADDFAIYFPQDAHEPCLGSGTVKKIVVKVAI